MSVSNNDNNGAIQERQHTIMKHDFLKLLRPAEESLKQNFEIKRLYFKSMNKGLDQPRTLMGVWCYN